MATVPKNTRSTTINLSVSSAGPFDVGFRLFDTDAIKVYVDGFPETAFTLTASLVNGYDDAATFTFASAVTAPATIIVEAAYVPWREADYINGDRNLVQRLNDEMARHSAALAELRRDVDRSVRGFTPLDPTDGIDLSVISSAAASAVAAAASASAASASAVAAAAAENSLLEWSGAWLTATSYAPSDIVASANAGAENGNAYICTQAHTSGTFATDLAAGKWALFVSKGASGAGTGDVLAANSGSEYVGTQATFRNNISAAVRVNTVQTGKDLHTDIADTATYDLGTGNTNAPVGQADGDALWSRRRDGSVQNFIALLANGTLHTKTRRGGTWGGWIAQATQSYVDSEIAATTQFLHVRDEKASGAHGGGSTAGSYLTRSLGTVVTNTIPGASLASNKITLPAGTYELAATAPGFGCGGFKAKIFNVTAAADLLIGSFGVAEATYQTSDRSHVYGRFTLAAATDIDLRMRCNVSRATNGLGYAAGYGDVEIYSEVRIWKVS